MATTDILDATDIETKVAIRPPKNFNVVLYNDNTTTMEFVILVLMSVFYKNFEEASALTMQIHELGRGIAGTYSLEVATQKQVDTLNAARINGFPLKCEVQET